MKKIALLLISASILLTGCGNNNTIYKGTAQGYGGGINVDVVVDKDGKVADIVVDAASETPAVGGEAAPKVSQSIIENQSLNVDVVTGATLTSNGVINAVRNALESNNVTFDGL